MSVISNFYNLFFKNFIFLPGIFLSICILILILYNFFSIEKFKQIYTFFFLIYSIISIVITLFLVIVNNYFAFDNGFFIINYKTTFIQSTILFISLTCLILFRRSLTKSRTNCLKYFIFYLFTVLVCLLTTLANINNLFFLFLIFEFVTICFYILSSFIFNNFGFLVFKFVPKNKLFYSSLILSFTGLLLIKSQVFLNIILNRYPVHIFLLQEKDCFITIGTILISISLLLKIVLLYSPTNFIYYKKTPLITIIFMQLVPKFFFFYYFSELVLLNHYFICNKDCISLVTLLISLSCLVISIGMRRLFLKHFIEYLALVNSGYLLLCFFPLNLINLIHCIYFLLFYVLIIYIYGGILLFYDDKIYPSLKVSFDTILFTFSKKKIYYNLILILIFFFLGMPPTRKDYPSSRGIPFNGFILQLLVFQSLIYSKMYLIIFLLIIFNSILFSFAFWTIIPFWQKKKKKISFVLPRFYNSLVKEFIILYLILLVLLIVQFDSILISNYVQTFFN